MDITITTLGYSLALSFGLEDVFFFLAGLFVMFIFDRWVLGRHVRNDLKDVNTRNIALEARISTLERNRQMLQESAIVSATAPVEVSGAVAGGLEGTVEGAVSLGMKGNALETWRVSPGAGYLAAKLIMQLPTLEEVREIYTAFRSAPQREDTARANWAFLYRLEDAGHGAEVYEWAYTLAGEDDEISPDEDTQAELLRWREEALANGA